MTEIYYYDVGWNTNWFNQTFKLQLQSLKWIYLKSIGQFGICFGLVRYERDFKDLKKLDWWVVYSSENIGMGIDLSIPKWKTLNIYIEKKIPLNR